VEKDDKIAAKNKIMATIKHRKNYQSDFKAKVALEAVKGRLTINEISKQFGVHPNQISKWKKQFLESLPQIFDNSKPAKNEQDEELVNQLYQQIGQAVGRLNLIGSKKICLFRLKLNGHLLSQTIKRFQLFTNVSFWASIV
jgi:transposase